MLVHNSGLQCSTADQIICPLPVHKPAESENEDGLHAFIEEHVLKVY